MYHDVRRIMYGLYLWEEAGDQFAETVWWPYVQPELDKCAEPLRRELAVAYILALFKIYQDFICLTFPEYVGRNEDWKDILAEIGYQADERALLYLAGQYNLSFPNHAELLLPVLLSLSDQLRKPIGQYLSQLYKSPLEAFSELIMNFPFWTKQNIEMGIMPYSKEGFSTFYRLNMTLPKTVITN